MEDGGILYLKCLKALYGHMEAARLFYGDLDSSLVKKMNFTRNQYDPCIYNRKSQTREMITVKTHVDDLKISSKSKEQVDCVVSELRDIYKYITVSEEEEHDYLGMVMTFDRKNNRVEIDMKKYIQGIIKEFEEMDQMKRLRKFLHLQGIIYFKLGMEKLRRFLSRGLVTFMQLLQNFCSL
jgi:hypothetical protein